MFTASAQTTITAKEVSSHKGEVVTVVDKVYGTKLIAATSMTILDVGGYYRNQTLTIVIKGADRAKFNQPEQYFKGKQIVVTGEVMDYKGKPEIIVNDTTQLKIKR